MKIRVIQPVNFLLLVVLLLLFASWRLIGFGGDEMANAIIIRLGYWFVVALICLIAASFYGFLHCRSGLKASVTDELPLLIRRHACALGLIAVLTTILHSHEPHRFRTMNDEYAFLMTSKMAHEYKTVAIPNRMYYFDNQPVYIGSHSDVRLPLFPVLASLIHDFSGYRTGNLFLLNFLLTPVFLALLYFLSYRVGRSRRLGLLALLLAFSVPLLAQVATSGGYDLLNVTLIMALGVIALSYLGNATPEKQTLLIYAGLLLSYCRYESVLYLGVVAFLVGKIWLRDRAVRLRLIDALSPVFLILPICYNLYYVSLESFNTPQIGDEIHDFFSSRYFFGNLGEAVNYFFVDPIISSTSVLVATLGLISVVYLFAHIFSNVKTGEISDNAVAFAPICLVIVIVLVLIFFNYWGQLTDYQAVRFALPPLVCLIPAIVWFIDYNKLFRLAHMWFWFGLTGIYCVAFAIPSQAQHHTTNSMIPSFAREFVTNYALTQGTDRTLFVSKAVLGVVAHGRPSVSVEFADANPDRLIDGYHFGHYDAIYTDQILSYDRSLGAFTVNSSLGAVGSDYRLETVALKRYATVLTFRIARVVAIRNSDGNWIDLLKPPNPDFKTDIDERLSPELFRKLP